MDRNLISVYRVGSISRIGPYSGTTACYVFNWSSGSEGSATAGAFNEGEQFAVFYTPGGAGGAKGDPGTISSINGGELTVIE
jgi:hypothetical protein